MMTGSVTSWKMTEDERLAYIAKHPIRPTKEAAKRSSTIDRIDHKWPAAKKAK
ncbi:hypothetical protein [Mesobacillus zeae]|uniref:hypothetical protein n=1 Tax=Mesobacillus zeae TaxID=1917180 RepID=UPI0015E728BF|nr:hypothetical protein [Mesobacillus zeae]